MYTYKSILASIFSFFLNLLFLIWIDLCSTKLYCAISLDVKFRKIIEHNQNSELIKSGYLL